MTFFLWKFVCETEVDYFFSNIGKNITRSDRYLSFQDSRFLMFLILLLEIPERLFNNRQSSRQEGFEKKSANKKWIF